MTDVEQHAARTDAAHAGEAAHEVVQAAGIDDGAQGGSRPRTASGSGFIARSPCRRSWMLGALASAAGFAFSTAASHRAARGIGPVASLSHLAGISPAYADTLPAGGGFDAFIALSGKLTGHTSFDPVLGKRAYEALSKADSQFTQNVAALNAWLQSHGGVPSDIVTQALQAERPNLAKTVSAITRAWYLGLVGDAPNVQVIAYESALMFEPVKDILTIPSYCRDVPFYWTRKPANA
ncbi:Twin-arginine translocation pathway signal [Paraburkholderia piptadeniae]|uniref:Twin-arginine translocation pathway signal n=1 Tax=Paraburkholderia piptadeniae TaxID=1701573 RepID=A0A1N7S6X3_9BURK|nr:sugar dehydrogenase complex small subunit [Paraburkholderia piptadeniae]SIT43077.1 Twin-arginine translocation pathway signal [Paraburkholderia piptadeniae]